MDTSYPIVEVMAYFGTDGHVRPHRFRLTNDDDQLLVVKVDELITVEPEWAGGNEMIVFKCRSVMGGQAREYTLKYEKETCQWLLKM